MFDGYHVSGFDVIWKPYLLSLESHVLLKAFSGME